MWLEPSALRRLCRARDLLRQPGDSAPSVPQIARAIGMSPFHFIRCFEAVFGSTPHQFRIRARLDRAKHLLALGQHSVTDVCLELGFSSLGSSSTLFSRRLGESPSAYARRVRVLAQVPGRLAPALGPGCFSLLSQLPAAAFRNFREAQS